MTDQSKQIVKSVVVSMGIVLVVISIAVIIYKKTRKDGDDTDQTNPFAKDDQKDFIEVDQNYTKTEIEQMQAWLFSKGTLEKNETIVTAIRDTGGIDGIMEKGFSKALQEAIKKGYVKDLNDLYKKSNK